MPGYKPSTAEARQSMEGYLAKHGVRETFEEMLNELVAHQPDDPFGFCAGVPPTRPLCSGCLHK